MEYGIAFPSKRDKPIKINESSLKKSQNRIEKLRPIRDLIAKSLKDVCGAGYVTLTQKGKKNFHIIAANTNTKKAIENAVDPKFKPMIKIIIAAPKKRKFNTRY